MNKTIAIAVLVIGVVGLFVFKGFSEQKSKANTVASSDASSISDTVRIGVDSWVGYYPLCSKNFRASLRNEGIRSICDDNPSLEERFEQLKKGELDFAVTSVDAYMSLGKDYQFPGSIIAVIDESKGGDALLAWEDSVTSIDDLKNNPAIRVALATDTPSEHLVRSLSVHFDVEQFKTRGQWLVQADSAEDAAKMLQDKQVDAAVVWEPHVTQSLQTPGIKKILGTEDTERLIVDVLLVRRELALDKPELVDTVLQNYFEAIKFYRESPDSLVRELKSTTGLGTADVQAMLEGVKWVDLYSNAHDWFSTVGGHSGNEYLIGVIESSYDILHDTAVLKENPLPDANPYLITQSSFIERLFGTHVGGNKQAQQESHSQVFPELSEKQWGQLREVGTLKVRKVSFGRSSSNLSLEAKNMLDQAAKDLAHYPNFRILVKGHTGISGDKQANRQLSLERAEAVTRYLEITHGIQEERLKAQGLGSEEPLSRRPNESSRSYKYRLPRVELILKAGTL
ncbi:phosphate ABC transporter substrate-binding/OmpA family protein [Vibrio fluminensis]|uniref:phosphate ABC transporter substrate-binding/OmpA family protein n=1 Tax=Vibrio fluminensis TaxID=2783614 RepID=UPI0018884194|nr:phosphate ABC transporter substrate-binding/OmpA family protein [Vibrio fluminensis]